MSNNDFPPACERYFNSFKTQNPKAKARYVIFAENIDQAVDFYLFNMRRGLFKRFYGCMHVLAEVDDVWVDEFPHIPMTQRFTLEQIIAVLSR